MKSSFTYIVALGVAALVPQVVALTGTHRLSGIHGSQSGKPIAPIESLALGESVSSDWALGCESFECVKRYVELPDSNFHWQHVTELEGTEDGVSWKGHVLKMTSQQWLLSNETNKPIWEHPLIIITPSNLKPESSDWATFWTGGDQALQEATNIYHMEQNQEVLSAARVSTKTGSIGVVLGNMPQQLLTFSADPESIPRSEDAIKAFSWKQFMQHPGRPEWPIEMPMVKAVVRGLDAVVEFTNASVHRFIATGCSKRGMTSVFATAYDNRIEAYAPCCISLNTPSVFRWQAKSLGTKTAVLVLRDYIDNEIMESIDTEAFDRTMGLTDAFNFVEKLTKPAMWMFSGRDDFFPPEITRSWWDLLPTEQKLIVIDANQGHAGKHSPTFLQALENFVSRTVAGEKPPYLKWNVDNVTGRIEASLSKDGPQPQAVRLWKATTCGSQGRRDFRALTMDPPDVCQPCGVALPGPMCKKSGGDYKSEMLDMTPGANSWNATVAAPPQGQFTAFFIEFEFSSPGGLGTWRLATETSVVPVSYPFSSCFGKDCGPEKLILGQQATQRQPHGADAAAPVGALKQLGH